jgi:hypothetical protein
MIQLAEGGYTVASFALSILEDEIGGFIIQVSNIL